MHGLTGTLALLALSDVPSGGPPQLGSLYPVYWNVNGWAGYVPEGSPQLPVRLSAFGFQAANLTATGGGCTMAGCSGCNHSLDCEPYPCPKKYWRGCWQGDMPQIHPDGTLVNGGVPQAGNLSRHLQLLREGVPRWLPDPDWAGNAVLDFEAWDPIWEENTASACPVVLAAVPKFDSSCRGRRRTGQALNREFVGSPGKKIWIHLQYSGSRELDWITQSPYLGHVQKRSAGEGAGTQFWVCCPRESWSRLGHVR